MKLFKNIFYFIWPPIELFVNGWVIKKQETEKNKAVLWESYLSKYNNIITDTMNLDELEKFTNENRDSEYKRRESLEKKAATYATANGLIVSIVSIVPTLFSDKWLIPLSYAKISGIAYFLAIICFFVSIYYSIQVTKLVGFCSPSFDDFLDALKDTKNEKNKEKKNKILLALAQMEWNESELLKKSNYLSVSESLFMRGIGFLAFAAVFSVGVKLFG